MQERKFREIIKYCLELQRGQVGLIKRNVINTHEKVVWQIVKQKDTNQP